MDKIFPSLTLSALLVSSLFAQETDRDNRPDLKKKADKPRIEQVNWDRVKERIEGAVKRGDMTREQANQKYSELKKTLEARPKGKRDQSPRKKLGDSRPIQGQRRPDALGRLLDELITQKKINRDDARRIFEAASASRPPMPDRSNRNDGVARELREILNQARNELAGLREAREELFREHEEREYHRNEHSEHQEREHHRNEHSEHEEREHHQNEHSEHEEREHHQNEHSEREEREHHQNEHSEHEEREHHRNEHSEHEEREHHQNEHPESEKAEHNERNHEESERAEMLRNKIELIKQAEILEEKRLQLEKEKRKVEKEKRIIETRRESAKVE